MNNDIFLILSKPALILFKEGTILKIKEAKSAIEAIEHDVCGSDLGI